MKHVIIEREDKKLCIQVLGFPGPGPKALRLAAPKYLEDTHPDIFGFATYTNDPPKKSCYKVILTLGVANLRNKAHRNRIIVHECSHIGDFMVDAVKHLRDFKSKIHDASEISAYVTAALSEFVIAWLDARCPGPGVLASGRHPKIDIPRLLTELSFAMDPDASSVTKEKK